MCGRFTLATDLERLKARFGFTSPSFEVAPRYNIAPTQRVPVIVHNERRELKLFRWGLIPAWAKDTAIGSKMINARSETALEKPSFKRLFKERRCLVPADGFYEWKHARNGKQKIPMRIVRDDGELFAMAGLWTRWHNEKATDRVAIDSFTILTTQANAAMKSIHDRMPLILDPENEELWIRPNCKTTKLQRLLKMMPKMKLRVYPVSQEVNSPKNDHPSCLTPITLDVPFL